MELACISAHVLTIPLLLLLLQKIQIIQSLENSEKDKEDEIRSLLSKIESLNSIIVDKNTEHLMTSECLSSTETKLREVCVQILAHDMCQPLTLSFRDHKRYLGYRIKLEL